MLTVWTELSKVLNPEQRMSLVSLNSSKTIKFHQIAFINSISLVHSLPLNPTHLTYQEWNTLHTTCLNNSLMVSMTKSHKLPSKIDFLDKLTLLFVLQPMVVVSMYFTIEFSCCQGVHREYPSTQTGSP